eukprot:9386602-Pyramimonas_sp.AAC.1
MIRSDRLVGIELWTDASVLPLVTCGARSWRCCAERATTCALLETCAWQRSPSSLPTTPSRGTWSPRRDLVIGSMPELPSEI